MITTRLALVTGAAQGIGRGCALALGKSGHDVCVVDLPEKKDDGAETTAQMIREAGGRAIVVGADVRDRASVEGACDEAINTFDSPLHVCVGTVGGNPLDGLPRGLILEETEEHCAATVDLSLMATWRLLQVVARRMGEPPNSSATPRSIVLIGSVMANWSRGGAAAYTMSKTGVGQLARTAAVELGPRQIRVNCVQPGWIDTPGERRFSRQEQMDGAAAVFPLRRMGTPSDVGDLVNFLASDAASYVTGTTIECDGGFSCCLDLPGGVDGDLNEQQD